MSLRNGLITGCAMAENSDASGSGYDCFISYASGDLELAEQLHWRLVAAGFTVWFDKARLNPGLPMAPGNRGGL